MNKPSAAPTTSYGPIALFLQRQTPWNRMMALVIIVLQIIWALVIPIKNVVMIDKPVFRVDSTETSKSEYAFYRNESSAMIIKGKDIPVILENVLEIVLGNHAVLENLQSQGSFDLDALYHLLSPQDFHTMAKYYTLLFQTTEFPGGVLTPRPLYAGKSQEKTAMGVWLRDTNGSDRFLPLACVESHAHLNGMKCFQGGSQDVCYDFPTKDQVRRYEFVDFEPWRTNQTGWANNIGQLYLIETFHNVMATLFSAKNWKKAVESQQFAASPDQALVNGFTSVFKDDFPLLLASNAGLIGVPLDAVASTAVLESCLVTELVASLFYGKAYVLQRIQAAVRKHNVFDPMEFNVSAPVNTLDVVTPLWEFDFFVSSGARFDPLERKGRQIFGRLQLTSIQTAAMRLKLDKRLNGDQQYGSSIRMLQFMAFYPEYYSFVTHTNASNTTVSYLSMQHFVFGGAMSGMNTFKNDWWANTMGVYRLSELPRDVNETNPIDPWWDQELLFAQWFQRLENSLDAPFLLLNQHFDIESPGIRLDDNPLTRCHRAFYKTLGKLAFLGLLGTSQPPAYLVFMSNTPGGAKPWFADTIRRFELYGETISGARHAFPFTSDLVTRKDDGSAWVTIPLYYAMVSYLGKAMAVESAMAGFNASFTSVVTTEYGQVHFPDMSHCMIGFQTNNITTDTNTIDLIAQKLYPSVEKFFSDLFDAIPAVFERLQTDMNQLHGIQVDPIRQEYLLGSNSTPQSVGWVGSPVFWQPTALTAGMLKFWPAMTPPQKIIDLYRNVTRCYQTLELRYLNHSTRCWVEEASVRKARTEYNSELLRNLIFSNWSISLVLNAIGIVIAVRFTRRLVRAWQHTKLRGVSIWVAMQLNFQGLGVLSISEVLLMTFSTVPLMFAYHLPSDPVFIPHQTHLSTAGLPKWLKEVLVTLGASWFVRLGFEIINQCLVLKNVSYWSKHFRTRCLCIGLVFVVRVVLPDELQNTEYEMWKLVLTCVVSLVLGGLSALVPFYKTTVAPVDRKDQSLVVMALRKHQMALNKHGLLGYSAYGWSVAALLVEGWEIVRRKAKNDIVLAYERCKIPLRTNANDELECLIGC